MSWLSSGLKKFGNWVGDRIGDGPSISGLKSSIKGTGKLVSKAAPVAAFIPGIGPLAAAALKVGGDLAAGKNLKGSLVDGALQYGPGKLLGAVPGVGKVVSAAGKLPGAGAVSSAVKKAGPLVDLARGAIGDGSAPIAPQQDRGFWGSILDAAKGEAGRVAGRLARGESPIDTTPGPGGTSLAGGLQQLLTLAGGAKELSDANGAASARNTLLGRMSGIANEEADYGRSLIAGQAPIRQAAEAQLLSRLQAPAPAPISLARFRDLANPFAARFAGGASPMAPPPGPTAPPAPTPGGLPPYPGAAPLPMRPRVPTPTPLGASTGPVVARPALPAPATPAMPAAPPAATPSPLAPGGSGGGSADGGLMARLRRRQLLEQPT